MKKKKDLYHKYITDECDETDREEISAELQRLNLEEDRDENLSGYDGEIDEDISRRLLVNIQYNTIEKPKIRKRRIIRLATGLGLIALMIGLTHVWRNDAKIQKATTFLENKVIAFNHTDTISIIQLPDHSIVSLSPKSSISYKAAFEGNRRNVYLKGTAIFKVSKDPSRPFNVFSGQVMTTAIGTEFKVSEYRDCILIKLLEGKIKVKKNVPTADNYYLIAGNAISYNIDNGTFTQVLNTANSKKPLSGAKRDLILKKAAKNAHLSLNNVPMGDALDKIAQQYGVEIEYSPTDVEDINIIATLNCNQPVQKILHNIALMNNLKIWKLDDREFIIQKMK